MNADTMYAEIILDYYRHPKNKGTIENPTTTARDLNPLCGDEIQIQLQITEEIITEAKFEGKGCAISQATTSILTEIIKEKKISEVPTQKELLEKIGVKISPARIKCALLGHNVLMQSLNFYTRQNHPTA
jgi:nitrogen fixation protein NifU and related proteins